MEAAMLRMPAGGPRRGGETLRLAMAGAGRECTSGFQSEPGDCVRQVFASNPGMKMMDRDDGMTTSVSEQTSSGLDAPRGDRVGGLVEAAPDRTPGNGPTREGGRAQGLLKNVLHVVAAKPPFSSTVADDREVVTNDPGFAVVGPGACEQAQGRPGAPGLSHLRITFAGEEHGGNSAHLPLAVLVGRAPEEGTRAGGAPVIARPCAAIEGGLPGGLVSRTDDGPIVRRDDLFARLQVPVRAKEEAMLPAGTASPGLPARVVGRADPR